MNLDLIDDTADCPENSMCIGSPRFSNWVLSEGPPPADGAKVLAVDAQSDLEFNAGALLLEEQERPHGKTNSAADVTIRDLVG